MPSTGAFRGFGIFLILVGALLTLNSIRNAHLNIKTVSLAFKLSANDIAALGRHVVTHVDRVKDALISHDDDDSADDLVIEEKKPPREVEPIPVKQSTSFIGPRKLLLVCLFTGGTQHSTGDQERVNARVNAQLNSWADTDVYYVTHMDIATDRRIWLPDEAESGGYKGIWRKTLHLFHNVSNSPFGQQYDYVFKGDDDTLLNIPLLRTLLKSFDESLPFQLGNNGYGVGCRGPAPTSPFYHQDRGTKPCHGGAGYVLSRGALSLMAPYFLGCQDEWPMSSYEDAKLSYCLMHHAAINCIGMKQHFGWDRYHNVKRDKVALKIKMLEKTPLVLARGISFHPVPEEFQPVIFNRLQNLSQVHHATILKETNQALAESHRYFVTQWNCTKASPTGAINALCQQYILRQPPLNNKPSSLLNVCSGIHRSACVWADQIAIDSSSKLHMKMKLDLLVIVPVASGFGYSALIRSRSLSLLLSSLQLSMPSAKVILLVDSIHSAIANSVAAEFSQVAIVSLNEVPKDDIYRLHGFAMLSLLVAKIISTVQDSIEIQRVAICSADVFFQADPVASVPVDDGLAVFMTESFPDNLTVHKTQARVAMQWMGTCNSKDQRALQANAEGPHSFRGPGILDTSVIIGTAKAVEVAMAELASKYCAIDKNYVNSCTPEQLFSRLVWYNEISERVPVMIPLQSSSPLVNLGSNDSSLFSINNGSIINSKGQVAVFVAAPENCMCCDNKAIREGQYSRDMPRWCPQVVLQSITM